MTFLLVFFGLLGAIGGVAGAYFYGLYLGEKGRREAAENLLVIGTPERSQPRRIAAPQTAEEFAQQPMSEQAIKQVAEGLVGLAKQEGKTLEPHQARAEAMKLLQRQDGGLEGFDP